MNNHLLIKSLKELGLGDQGAAIYLELIKAPSTYLQLSHVTGINRTKIYRIVSDLERQSLITRRTDDRGTFLHATEPEALEVAIVNKEEKLQSQRQILGNLLPHLNTLHTGDTSLFTINTYDGQDGLKQMCWHELKTDGELLGLGNGTIEEIVGDSKWAYRHRQRQIETGYTIREIINQGYNGELPPLASNQLLGSGLYKFRVLASDIAKFDSQMIIYNDTVAIYHWKHAQQVGVEIISETYAATMRQIFQTYWQLAHQYQR